MVKVQIKIKVDIFFFHKINRKIFSLTVMLLINIVVLSIKVTWFLFQGPILLRSRVPPINFFHALKLVPNHKSKKVVNFFNSSHKLSWRWLFPLPSWLPPKPSGANQVIPLLSSCQRKIPVCWVLLFKKISSKIFSTPSGVQFPKYQTRNS